MIRRPRTFTFYSYKGGVGRSMALLNVAYTLHSMGRHILIVDLDLEAPGVSGFLHRKLELAPSPYEAPDILDLLAALMPAVQGEPGFNRPALPELASYLREVRDEKFSRPRNHHYLRTRLDVLCASDARDYSDRLAALDITSLTGDQIAAAGNLLREVFFNYRFPWQWQLQEKAKPTGYDYILIDSRTGFTEIGGLCIGPLADRLLIFCGLNDQNIHGTNQFLRAVGLSPAPRTQLWDDADSLETDGRPPSLGEKPAILVASPVPYGEMEAKEERFAEMKNILGIAPAANITYHPRLAIIETIFCRDGRGEDITGQYRKLSELVMQMIGDHPKQLLRRLSLDNSGGERAQPEIDEFKRYSVAAPVADGAQLAWFLVSGAATHLNHAKAKSGTEADALFNAAGKKYRAALAIKPDMHEALNNWGNALVAQAQQKTGADADALFSAAVEKYQTAIAISPEKHEALNN